MFMTLAVGRHFSKVEAPTKNNKKKESCVAVVVLSADTSDLVATHMVHRWPLNLTPTWKNSNTSLVSLYYPLHNKKTCLQEEKATIHTKPLVNTKATTVHNEHPQISLLLVVSNVFVLPASPHPLPFFFFFRFSKIHIVTKKKEHSDE